VQAANLNAGTYLITGTCAILHLKLSEFSRWITDKTIFRRITDFKRAVKEPVLLIEGAENIEVRTVSPSAFRAALAFVTVNNRVPVLFAANESESADLIYAMVNQSQNGMGLSLDSSGMTSPAPESPDQRDEHSGPTNGNGNGHGNGHGIGSSSEVDLIDLPEQIVRMIPEVGPDMAQALLRRFGSLRAVFAATAQDLTKIDGIGPKQAKKLASFFSRREIR